MLVIKSSRRSCEHHQLTTRPTGVLLLLSSGPAINVAAWKGVTPLRDSPATCSAQQGTAQHSRQLIGCMLLHDELEAWHPALCAKTSAAPCMPDAASSHSRYVADHD